MWKGIHKKVYILSRRMQTYTFILYKSLLAILPQQQPHHLSCDHQYYRLR